MQNVTYHGKSTTPDPECVLRKSAPLTNGYDSIARDLVICNSFSGNLTVYDAANGALLVEMGLMSVSGVGSNFFQGAGLTFIIRTIHKHPA